jgi:hypothetical protein
MPTRKKPGELEVRWRFGSGTDVRTSPDEINPTEDAGGVNFALDLQDTSWRPRAPIKEIADFSGYGCDKNPIRGWAQLHKTDGSISTVLQIGSDLYEWDGIDSDGLTYLDYKVHWQSALWGDLNSQWSLGEEVVLIADRNLKSPVLTWDGVKIRELKEQDCGVSDFRAKYIYVENERAWFGNLHESGTPLPHMIAASARGDYKRLTVTDRPTSALGTGDPFQLTTPDLRAINGLVEAFGVVVFSTFMGNMWRLVGETSQDFVVLPLYSNSAATGQQGVVYVGNDVFYGRYGSIESLSSAQTLADVSVDDLSRQIFSDLPNFNVKNTPSFRMVYDRDRGLVYCQPECDQRLYVFHKALWDEIVQKVSRRANANVFSPWAMWEDSTVNFADGIFWNMLDPRGRMQVYISQGMKIYQLQYTQDCTAWSETSERISAAIEGPLVGMDKIDVWVSHKAAVIDNTLTLTFEEAGIKLFDDEISITLDKISPLGPTYGGSYYYDNSAYYSTQYTGRISRTEEHAIIGRPSRFQIKASITGGPFSIQEIGIRFKNVPEPNKSP